MDRTGGAMDGRQRAAHAAAAATGAGLKGALAAGFLMLAGALAAFAWASLAPSSPPTDARGPVGEPAQVRLAPEWPTWPAVLRVAIVEPTATALPTPGPAPTSTPPAPTCPAAPGTRCRWPPAPTPTATPFPTCRTPVPGAACVMPEATPTSRPMAAHSD
jgi:hypothetical protein